MPRQIPIYFLALSFTLCISCQTSKFQKSVYSQLMGIEKQHQNHMGLLVYDLESKKTLLKYKENTLFVPASNMKIVTLYAALENLGDSLLMFKYKKDARGICITGQANPTLLHPYFDNSRSLNFLKSNGNITYDSSNFYGEYYGYGWAWEDYADSYQAEISPLPIYGNVVWFNESKAKSAVMPSYFENNIQNKTNRNIAREPAKNTFYAVSKESTQVPFITSAITNVGILEQAIGQKISLGSCGNLQSLKPFYSSKADSVYRKMMFESDNMLAEHLLLQASQKYTDSLSTTLAIQKIRNKLLPGTAMRWVDGAGLSRYNLISPQTLVGILDNMQSKHGFDVVKQLFPQVGMSGTLKTASSISLPIYAKTGSLGGVYNLSGYLISAKGKKLVFSYMCNNTLRPLREIKAEMIKTLEQVIATN